MKKIIDIHLIGKRVLIRCDLNVPIKNNVIQDETRIIKSIDTIKYALKNANKVIIISHLGRIKTREDLEKNSLKIVCERLSNLLNEKIVFCTYEEDVYSIINNNKIVMLENTRFFDLDNNKESNNDKKISEYFASLADVFINDAFGVLHREASSTVGVSKLLPSAIGFLVENEINKLSELFNPKKPFSIILGGNKVSDKIGIIYNLIDKIDNIVIVGKMAFTFLKADGINVLDSMVEENYLSYAKDLLTRFSDKIILPLDVYEADDINGNNKKLVNIDYISKEAFDIGPKTIQNIKDKIKLSETIFLNGPAGVFENEEFSYGTKTIIEYLNTLNSKIIIGGGDSVNAVNKFAKNNNFYHISTGGGASLEFLSGNDLPGLKYIGE